jgi:hypothetical protein
VATPVGTIPAVSAHWQNTKHMKFVSSSFKVVVCDVASVHLPHACTPNAHACAHTHTRTRVRARARTHTHTHSHVEVSELEIFRPGFGLPAVSQKLRVYTII